MDFGHFHLFPQLPKELRDHVWRMALPPARLLEIQPIKVEDMGNGFQNNINNGRHYWTANTSNSLAIILLVCREAAAIVMDSYELTNICTSVDGDHPSWTKTLLNYNKDIFYFSEDTLKSLQPSSISSASSSQAAPIWLKKMQVVAFPSNGWQDNSEHLPELKPGRQIRKLSIRFLTQFLPLFANMKILLLVINCRDHKFLGDDVFWEPSGEFLLPGREKEGFEIMSLWSESLLKDLVVQHPSAEGLRVQVGVMINGTTYEERAHCMAFFRRCCRYVSRPLTRRARVPYFWHDDSSSSEESSVWESGSEVSLRSHEDSEFGRHSLDPHEDGTDEASDGGDARHRCCSIP